jgi:hypothetical protein
VLRSVVGTAWRVSDGMGKLMFNQVWPDLQFFVNQ